MEGVLAILNREGGLWEDTQIANTKRLNMQVFAETFGDNFPLFRGPNGGVQGIVIAAAEGSKTTGDVVIEPLTLVQHVMDTVKWRKFFPCIIADEIKSYLNPVSAPIVRETAEATIEMEGQFQVLTPVVGMRQTKFTRTLRRRYNERTHRNDWVVYDLPTEGERQLPFIRACYVEETNPGVSRVTWMELAQYDQLQVPNMYQGMLQDGRGFGSLRWFETLARECRRPSIYSHELPGMREKDKQIPFMAQRMTHILCLGISNATRNSNKRIPSPVPVPNVAFGTSFDVEDNEEDEDDYLTAARSRLVNAPYDDVFLYVLHSLLPHDHSEQIGDLILHVPRHDAENYVGLYRCKGDDDAKFLTESFKDPSGGIVVTAPITNQRLKKKYSDKSQLVLDSIGYVISPAGAQTVVTVAHQLKFRYGHDQNQDNLLKVWMNNAAAKINHTIQVLLEI